jgi:MSHA biogenesis protein MshI
VLVQAPGEYDLVQVNTPAVPDDELRDALRCQLRGSLPYSPDEAALDFVRVPQAAEAPQRPTLLVLVAPRSTVTLAVAPLLDCGVDIEAVDVPELAQRNLLQLAGAGDGTTAWLGFESNACLLTVHVGTVLAFARRIPVTGLAHDVETEHQLAYLSERIGTQVQRSLDLVERQLGQPPASRILLSPHRHAQRIARDVAERTGLQANVFDPLLALHVAEPGMTPDIWGHDVMIALGAALRVEEAPPPKRASGGWRQRIKSLRRLPALSASA